MNVLRKRGASAGLCALLLVAAILPAGSSYVRAETEEASDAAIYVSEAQEIITSEAQANGETVADAIGEIIEAAGQLELADGAGLERLQTYISGTQQAYEDLPDEEKSALEESMELLEHASVSVDSMQDAMTQLDETGSFTLEQTGRPNSWRYINGVPIENAMGIVEEERREVTGDKEAPMDYAEMTTIVLPAGTPFMEKGVLTATTTTLKGIDISRWNWNKPIEWAKVKNEVDFVIIQCGYGSDLTSQDDMRWAESVAACERYGIPYGAYLYSYATTEAMVDSEVAHTLRLLKGHNPTFPVFWDSEEDAQRLLGAQKLSAMAERYCSKIRAAGYKSGVYASTSWWNSYFPEFAKKNEYFHWVAHWGVSSCGYTGRYEIWQYTSQGSVNGIVGDVDMNYWYGNSLEGWMWMKGSWYYIAANGKPVTNAWRKDSTGWCYLGADGTWVKEKWIQSGGHWYYLGPDGYLTENAWIRDSKGWCYLDAEGKMVVGRWLLVDNEWYYVDGNGHRKENAWIQDNTGWCYLGGDGKRVKGEWLSYGGTQYYLNEDGYMATNVWESDSQGQRYLGDDGKPLKNSWIKTDGEWYYLNAEGYREKNAWVKDSKGWCYLDANGQITKSKWIWDKTWYYLNADGYLTVNAWVRDTTGWCYLDANGKITKGKWIWDKAWYYLNADGYRAENAWVRDTTGWCYLGANGQMVTSQWIKTGSTWYYLNASGHMVTGTQVINGKTYVFSSSGAWIG